MRPRVTLQLAHSSDGFIARKVERTTLTCRAGWQRVYAERALYDAIMVGSNTAILDNPRLTSHGHGKNPIRIIVDTHAKLPPESEMAQTARETPVWLLTSVASNPALEALGVRLIQCSLKDGRIDMPAALKKLDGIKTLVCEGGAGLAQTLNTEGLVDKLNLIEATEATLGDGIPLPVLTGFTPVLEEVIDTDIWRSYVKR